MPPKRRHHGRKKKAPRNKQYDNWDEYDWEDLTPELQDAAKVLRWNPQMWDSDGKARTEDYDWKELSKAQRRAARAFGYNHGIWDEDLRPYKMRQKGRAMVTRRDRDKFDKKHGHGTGPADSDASSSDEDGSDVSYSSIEEYPESDDSEAEEGEIDFEVEPEDEEPPAPPPKEEKEEEDVKVEELPAEDITQAYNDEQKENEIKQQQLEEEAKKRQEEEAKRQQEEEEAAAAAAAAAAAPPPPEEEEEEPTPPPPPPVEKPTRPMFRVSKTYGKSKNGTAFDHGNNASITKIVTFSDRHCVRGLQVTYNKTFNMIAGNTKTGMTVFRKEYKLDDDGTEFIDTIRVRSNKFVQSLTFITNKGKRFGPVGGKGWKKINFMHSDTCGELVEIDAPGNEMQLCGLAGRAGKLLDAIAFRWGPTVRSTN